MTNDIKKTVETYHNQFSVATTDQERQQLAATYRLFFDQLTADEQALAREAARPYWEKTRQKIEEMEPVLQRAKEMLQRHYERTTAHTTEAATRQ